MLQKKIEKFTILLKNNFLLQPCWLLGQRDGDFNQYFVRIFLHLFALYYCQVSEQIGELYIHCKYGCKLKSGTPYDYEVNTAGCPVTFKLSNRQ